MTNKQRNLIKKSILKCLKDFDRNQAIFSGTDLFMVMDKVVKGLEMAKYQMNIIPSKEKTDNK